MRIQTRGIIWYLILAFGLAWILWEIPFQLGVSPDSPYLQFILLPGAFAPAIATIVVRKWITQEGFADAGLRLHLKQWPYYLVAWFLPLVVVGAILGVNALFRVGVPNFDAGAAVEQLIPSGQELPENMPRVGWPLIIIQSLLMALLATPVLWGEEFGWRGYLQIRLLGNRPVLAAITTGIIWGVWHYPLNLRGYNFPDHPIAGLVVFPASAVMLSIILGWLRYRSGSIWAASLGHAATNSIGASLTALLFAGSPTLYTGYVGLLAWVPLGAICLWIIATGRLPWRCEERAYAGISK